MQLVGANSQEKGHRILLRFTTACDWPFYTNLPLMIMHEYASHIFADDDGMSDIFNDGWLFYATAAFLLQQRGNKKYSLCCEEIDAFDEYWWGRLEGVARQGCYLARTLRETDGSMATRKGFEALTFELAEKSSRAVGRPTWHVDLLRGLYKVLAADPRRALQLMSAYRDSHDLMRVLGKAKP